jgi:Protein required for attachment to host cells.
VFLARHLKKLAKEHHSDQHKPEFEDRQGHVYSSTNDKRNNIIPRTDPKHKIEVAFIQNLIAHLIARAETNAFDRLIVTAEPRALNDFRATAPKTLTEKISREINNNYMNTNQKHLLQTLEE